MIAVDVWKKSCMLTFYRLIHCTWVYPIELFAPFFGYYFFNVMLLVLQMLHFYWAALISRMLYKCIFNKVLCSSIHMCRKRRGIGENDVMSVLQVSCLWKFVISPFLNSFSPPWLSFPHLSFSTSTVWRIILQLEGDDRSDEDEDDSDPPKERNHRQSHMNGTGARGRANGHWCRQKTPERNL